MVTAGITALATVKILDSDSQYICFSSWNLVCSYVMMFLSLAISFQWSAESYTVEEGVGSLILTLIRLGATSFDANVSISTTDGSTQGETLVHMTLCTCTPLHSAALYTCTLYVSTCIPNLTTSSCNASLYLLFYMGTVNCASVHTHVFIVWLHCVLLSLTNLCDFIQIHCSIVYVIQCFSKYIL